MPQRRAEAFTEICVRRAKTLALFDLSSFSEALGGGPAIRRTHRTWVAEFLDRDSANADALFTAVVFATDIAQHFRDDTIIAFLRSPRAPELLRRHAEKILADDKRLFWRIVHLLRVGCVTLPAWAPAAIASSLFFQPEGAAWESVLRLVQENLALFGARDRQQLLSLLEDWAKGVSHGTPRPPGHEAAAAIVLWLIPFCTNYDSEDLLQRALSVLAKIPASDSAGFERVLRGRDDDRRDAAAEKLEELLFDGIEGYPAARDLPKVVISAGKDYFLIAEDDTDDPYHSSIDIDQFFGMDRSHGSHLPPSAYRGPFRSLLREHPKDGRDFVVDLLNHAGTWYGERRGRGDRLEPAWEIELTFADGTKRTQWANPRLWNLYRGTSVTPYPLQSAAMALEAWLFEVAEQDKNLLDPLLIQTLRMSDSVAVTAIVASLAVRYPYAWGETLLVLLSSPDCIRMDRIRMVQDQTGSVHGRLLHSDAMKEVFRKEREDSDALPHRRRDLEMAITQLQASPVAARVHAALDAHLAAMPPIEKQTKDDQVWRFALHRMDLRKYRVADADEVPEGSGPDASAETYIVLTPEDPDPDLKAVMQQTAQEHSRVSSRLGDQLWAVKVFEREADERYDPAEWRTRLTSVFGKKRYLEPDEVERVRAESADAARKIICSATRALEDEIDAASNGWFAAEALLAVTSIALGAPNEARSIAVFSESAATLVAWWHADRYDRVNRRESHSYETEYALQKAVVEALFRVNDANAARIAAPLLAAVDEHPEKVGSLIEDLTFREDRDPSTERYWVLWKMFAEQAASASWLADVDSKYSEGKQYLTAVFLSRNWKDTTRHWRSIVGHHGDLHGLFERLPLSRTSLHRYLRFLHHIGEQSLPEAFVRLHEQVKNADLAELLTERDSAFILESLLLRYVYAKPLELKRQHALRAAVLFLLDALVETGSSSAFRMRDDFVTPLSPPTASTT